MIRSATVILAPVFSALAAGAATRLLITHRIFQATNWKGVEIPRGYGISFPLAQTLALVWWRETRTDLGIPPLFVLALWGMAAVGLMDDLSGEAAGGGFRGHMRALFRDRRITVGLVKALLGGLVCLATGFAYANADKPEETLLPGLVNGLLLALSANSVNLFDVRPGRAAKAALVVYTLALATVPESALPYLPVAMAAAIFLPADCHGRVMMGDAGAYPLGFAIGLAFLPLSLPVKATLCCILAAFHLYCEFSSVTAAIERSRLLKWVDNWWVT